MYATHFLSCSTHISILSFHSSIEHFVLLPCIRKLVEWIFSLGFDNSTAISGGTGCKCTSLWLGLR